MEILLALYLCIPSLFVCFSLDSQALEPLTVFCQTTTKIVRWFFFCIIMIIITRKHKDIYIHIYILNMWLLSLFNIRIKTSALHFNKLIAHFCIQETGHSLLTWQEHSLLQDLDHMRSHNFNLIPASFQLIIRKCTDFLVKNQKTLLVSLGHRIQSPSPL